MSDLLEGLNTEQLQAVTYSGGPLLIVAGAGTGKTTVITRRIAWLIEQGLAKPEEILALTFTEKASSEMEERVDLLSPLGYVDFWISTFHAFCERILKIHALDIGLSNDFKLLDETKQWLLVHKNFQKFELDYYRPLGSPAKHIDALLTHFSRCKDELIGPSDYLKHAQELELSSGRAELVTDEEKKQEILRIRELANAFHVYQKLLLDNGFLDFGDLINCTIELFQKRPGILKYYQQKFKYIFVDEFQDTNLAQYELVKLLVGSGKLVVSSGQKKNKTDSQALQTTNNKLQTPQITVVGDDDQSIYKFRGASVSNILRFKEDYKDAQQITLTQNYRSSQEILDLAYKFIQHNNPDRLETKLGIDKHLVNPLSPPSANLEVLEGADLAQEMNLVVKRILGLKAEHSSLTWNDFAVLIRSNSAADEVLPRLEASAVPYTFVANKGLFKKPLIAQIISYLELIDNYHNSGSLYRVFSLPKFKIGAVDLAKLSYAAYKHTLSLYEVISSSSITGTLEAGTQEILKLLLTTLAEHTEKAKTLSAVEVFVYVIKDLGMAQVLEEETLENAQNRELLEQFYKFVEAFEQDGITGNKSLRAFLENLQLEVNAGNEGKINFDPNLGPESVKVMTVHASKGLEFEHVFVIGLVDQRFPTRERKESIAIPDALIRDILPEGDFHLQEERRLFYVAVTRAKRGLYLSWAKDYGGARSKKPSLFLEETGLVPSDKISKATGKVVFTKQNSGSKSVVYQDLPVKFSFSAIQNFLKCPLEYKYAYFLRLPLPGSPQRSFGTTIHGALEDYLKLYKQSLERTQHDLFGKADKVGLPSYETLLELYQKNWIDEWYVTKDQKIKYKEEQGLKILKNFYDRTVLHPPKLKFLEEKFTLNLGEFTFTGKIDRADDTLGGLTILDYKTGKKPKSKSADDMDQLKIYQWAAEEQFNLHVKSMCYWYLENDEFLEVPIATPEEIEELRERLLQTVIDIREATKYDTFAQIHAKSKQHTCNFEDWG